MKLKVLRLHSLIEERNIKQFNTALQFLVTGLFFINIHRAQLKIRTDTSRINEYFDKNTIMLQDQVIVLKSAETSCVLFYNF